MNANIYFQVGISHVECTSSYSTYLINDTSIRLSSVHITICYLTLKMKTINVWIPCCERPLNVMAICLNCYLYMYSPVLPAKPANISTLRRNTGRIGAMACVNI